MDSKELQKDIFQELTNRRILFLNGEITSDNASMLAAQLLSLDLQSSDLIKLYINSIGGSISDGLFVIYDVMTTIRSKLNTIAIGEAYSSAAILLCAGSIGLRQAHKHSKIMIHGISVDQLSGTQSEIQTETRQLKKLNNEVMNILSLHTKQTLKKIKRDCSKDHYFSPQEAQKYGLIDSII